MYYIGGIKMHKLPASITPSLLPFWIAAHDCLLPSPPSLYCVSSLPHWCTLEVFELEMKAVTCRPA